VTLTATKPAWLTPTDTIKIRPVRWLWQDRLPLGALSLLVGLDGVGKSITALTLAADVTRGRLAGDYLGRPRAVVVYSADDSRERTILPRLLGAGADLDLVYLDPVGDFATIEEDVVDAALIIVDPMRGKDADYFAAVAEDLQVSALGISRAAKKGSSMPKATPARAVIVASGARIGPQPRRLSWRQTLDSGPSALTYRVVGTQVADGVTAAKVEWLSVPA
jgi:hypothetical protein